MSMQRFLVVAVAGGLVAAAALALAAALDAPGFYVPALLAIVIIFMARDGWLWEGDGRGWLMMIGTLIAAIALVFLLQRVLG